LCEITIPSGVTSIGGMAFYNCYSLCEITISSGATSIGASAFFNCYSLLSIKIPKGFVAPAFSIAQSDKFTESSMIEFANNLGVTTVPTTLTFAKTLQTRYNASTWAIITGKGYTVAFA
jgi:hypothetical protein